MSESHYMRAVDCYAPRGPISKSTFYRHARAGHVVLKHVGRMTFVPFGCVSDLIEHLEKVVPLSDRFGRPVQSEDAA